MKKMKSIFAEKKPKPNLLACAANGDLEGVKEALKNGADINIQVVPKQSHSPDEGNTALYAAAEGGHQAVVEFLLEQGANVNLSNKNQNTPLIAAASKGHVSIVKLLLNEKADSNAQNKAGFTALMLASGNGYVEIVDVLLKAGADTAIKNKTKQDALLVLSDAAKNKRLDENIRDEISELILIKKNIKAMNKPAKLLMLLRKRHDLFNQLPLSVLAEIIAKSTENVFDDPTTVNIAYKMITEKPGVDEKKKALRTYKISK